MKKLFWIILVSLWFVTGALAQSSDDRKMFPGIIENYKKARAVALVKIKSVNLVEDKGYVTYAVDGEIVESFKGKLRRGQPLKYYFVVEPGYDVNRYPSESILFLEGKHPVSSGGNGWFQLENSNLSPSSEYLPLMRRIKAGNKRNGAKRRAARRRI